MESEAGKKEGTGTQQQQKATSPATIYEEGHRNVRQKQPSGGKGIEGAWRTSSNKSTDRRKSADLGASQQEHNKPKQNRNDRQKSFDHVGVGSQEQPATKERRKSYNRTNSHKNYTQSSNMEHKGQHRGSTTRRESGADAAADSENGSNASSKRLTRGSTTSNGKSRIGSTNSNGESFEYDDMDLDEPFTDSDEESPRHHLPQKPCLIIPRGRIRTLSGTVPPVGNSPKWGGPTMCLSCLQFFNLPEQIGKFAEHLLEEHHIVIEEVDLIVDPKRYVEHWRQRFAKEPVDKIFPKKVPKEEDPYFGRVEYYFEMSERITEDYGLRQRLAMRRLEEALGCQQREREEVNFSMQCIFCRYVARGNRSKIIHHLYMIHHLNLGSPDNLVFVGEYIDHLKEKLQRNECIYCEKTFGDRQVLMEHMRKRNHREVNPKNNYYDKFYIINYLELGKRWLDVLAEDFEDTMPTFADSDDEEEEESWHEWQEDNTDEDQLRVVCLYCEHSTEKVDELVKHIKEIHSFDLLDFFQKEQLDVYGRMKFLNFVRKQNSNVSKYRARSRNSNSNSNNRSTDEGTNDGGSEESRTISPQSPREVVIPVRSQWDTEESLVPVFGNDHLPWMLESMLEGEKVDEQNKGGEGDEAEEGALQLAGGTVRKSKSVGESGELDHEQVEMAVNACLAESKKNTIEGVVAEDFPELKESVLADQDMYKSLR